MLGSRHGINAQSHHIELTYLGHFASGAATGIGIGSARPDRTIIAIADYENDGASAMGILQFNGANAASPIVPTLADWIGMAYKQVTSGTTLSVTGTYSYVGLWMATGIAGTLYNTAGGASGATSYAGAATAPAQGGVVIAGARSRGAASGWSAGLVSGITGLALNDSYNFGGGGNPGVGLASGKLDGSGTTASLTINNATYSSGYGIMGVFI